jgi:hypothetical protein
VDSHAAVLQRRLTTLRIAAQAFALTLFAAAGSALADELRGTVRGPTGAAVADADFDVYDPETGEKLAESDNSDAAGRYRLTLEAGVYDVLCEPSLGSGLAAKMVHGVVVSGSTTLDLTLGPAAEVRGRAFDALNPDPGTGGAIHADLDFDRTEDGVRAPAINDATAADGSFTCLVEAGSYTITVSPDEATGLAPARVFGWTVPTTATLMIPLWHAVHFSGLIRDEAGSPVAAAVLKFDDALGRRIPVMDSRSATDGSFRVGVAPGVYRVTVEPASGGRCVAIRLPDVDVMADRAQDLTLAVGVVVSGRVTDKMGHVVSGADWDVVSETTSESAFTPGDRSGADGRYRFVVALGSYRLRVIPPAASGLDTLTFRNVSLARDTTLDVDYAALSGETGEDDSPVLRFAPMRNPTRTGAALALVLSAPIHDARVEIFDIAGARVRELHRGALAAGARVFVWDGRRRDGQPAHTGVYLVRAQLDGFDQMTRFILLP